MPKPDYFKDTEITKEDFDESSMVNWVWDKIDEILLENEHILKSKGLEPNPVEEEGKEPLGFLKFGEIEELENCVSDEVIASMLMIYEKLSYSQIRSLPQKEKYTLTTAIQMAIHRLGYWGDVWAIDGKMWNRTRAWMRELQRYGRITVDWILWPDTIDVALTLVSGGSFASNPTNTNSEKSYKNQEVEKRNKYKENIAKIIKHMNKDKEKGSKFVEGEVPWLFINGEDNVYYVIANDWSFVSLGVGNDGQTFEADKKTLKIFVSHSDQVIEEPTDDFPSDNISNTAALNKFLARKRYEHAFSYPQKEIINSGGHLALKSNENIVKFPKGFLWNFTELAMVANLMDEIKTKVKGKEIFFGPMSSVYIGTDGYLSLKEFPFSEPIKILDTLLLAGPFAGSESSINNIVLFLNWNIKFGFSSYVSPLGGNEASPEPNVNVAPSASPQAKEGAKFIDSGEGVEKLDKLGLNKKFKKRLERYSLPTTAKLKIDSDEKVYVISHGKESPVWRVDNFFQDDLEEVDKMVLANVGNWLKAQLASKKLKTTLTRTPLTMKDKIEYHDSRVVFWRNQHEFQYLDLFHQADLEKHYPFLKTKDEKEDFAAYLNQEKNISFAPSISES